MERLKKYNTEALTCKIIAIDDKAKYIGNSLACKLPNVLRGKFLNIVMPKMKVVYTMVPNQVANENKCRAAMLCADNK